MKSKFSRSEIEKRNWWRIPNVSTQKKTAVDSLNSPVCKLAEEYFLSYLYFLYRYSLNPTNRIREEEVYHFHGKKSTMGITIKKMPCQLNSNHYSFGLDTKLVLTGELAGTIASTRRRFIFNKIDDSDYQSVSIRPLFDHGQISKIILEDIATFEHQDVNEVHLAELLRGLKDFMTQQNGFLPALNYLLNELQLGADIEIIQQNSLLMKKIVNETVAVRAFATLLQKLANRYPER